MTMINYTPKTLTPCFVISFLDDKGDTVNTVSTSINRVNTKGGNGGLYAIKGLSDILAIGESVQYSREEYRQLGLYLTDFNDTMSYCSVIIKRLPNNSDVEYNREYIENNSAIKRANYQRRYTATKEYKPKKRYNQF